MDQGVDPQQQNIQDPNNPANVSGQAFGPYNYPSQQQWQQPEPVQQAQDVVPQQPQPGVVGSSPEVPARVEQAEPYTGTEDVPEAEKSEEEGEKREKGRQKEEKFEAASEPVPDQKKFESPFKVYGYQASAKMAAKGKKSSSLQVRGNPSLAKTWLIVLLGRLLRMHAG